MTRRLRPPSSARLRDDETEAARRDLADRIVELQGLPCVDLGVLENIELKDGVETPIAHGLGRRPVWVKESTVRGATATGRIVEIRDAKYDRTKVVVLKASGHGATIYVDVAVL